MKYVGVGLETAPISCLQLAQFLRLWFMCVNREALVDEKIPDFFSALPRVERFVLRVAYSAELLVRGWRFRAITLTDKLNDAFTLIDLLAKNLSQIATFGSENILPDWLVTEKSQRVGYQLPGIS
ncbi:MAG: hypothetical protein M3O72_06150 [Verrucomicrobiota bacterium]|nr:hypothetical protein [Verrucomicrobiota bacterium]